MGFRETNIHITWEAAYCTKLNKIFNATTFPGNRCSDFFWIPMKWDDFVPMNSYGSILQIR